MKVWTSAYTEQAKVKHNLLREAHALASSNSNVDKDIVTRATDLLKKSKNLCTKYAVLALMTKKNITHPEQGAKLRVQLSTVYEKHVKISEEAGQP